MNTDSEIMEKIDMFSDDDDHDKKSFSEKIDHSVNCMFKRIRNVMDNMVDMYKERLHDADVHISDLTDTLRNHTDQKYIEYLEENLKENDRLRERIKVLEEEKREMACSKIFKDLKQRVNHK